MANWSSLEHELEQLKKEGRYRPISVWESGSDTWMNIGGRRVLQMSSNNYLGLTNHPDLKKAAIQAIEQYGVGSGSVRTITGTLDIHDQLEQELAAFKGTEAALVFQSGFTTNQGVMTILGTDDVVISDELNHASIIDGIRLTKAQRRIYAHKDMDQLEAVLRECGSFAKRVVVTDGVFSMDGDIAPLPAIVELAEKYDAIVFVDDAHASGVLGRNGKGSTDHFGLNGRVHIQVGTLSKAVGAVGGYVAGDQVLKNFLVQKARPFLFSTSAPPSVAATCLAAIRVLKQSESLIGRLWSNATYFRTKVQALGFDTGASETPIVPVIVGEPAKAMLFSDLLLQQGVFAQGIVFPTVAMDKGRVRFIVTANHTLEDLDFAIDALVIAGKKLGLLT
ncbi:8-amino-7-oxononanoate synthase/2-amino-3-ketobutyrate coenzyme A ligase [Paenibacillus allorhizoplanae]|uniref:8-amino-7-ketopelargonate synthase n=1 Tax=Paenibacillus allorhizoplanae TaxID=2905648 RepID=A0ABM9C4U8_9BACL|nr:glycine C-acetyltransferase [Paenibacillus allorhizoplanae]CAH1202103.1 8-amino-7-oxononanoate synthase/2-amino-3-ketobutyrate coenzyme A ligase [Paenibacillus allorhizoplanae]